MAGKEYGRALTHDEAAELARYREIGVQVPEQFEHVIMDNGSSPYGGGYRFETEDEERRRVDRATEAQAEAKRNADLNAKVMADASKRVENRSFAPPVPRAPEDSGLPVNPIDNQGAAGDTDGGQVTGGTANKSGRGARAS